MSHFIVSLFLLGILLILKAINKQYCLLLILSTIFTLDLFFIIGCLPVWGICALALFFSPQTLRLFRKAEIPLLCPLSFTLLSYLISFLLGEHNTLPSISNPLFFFLLFVLACTIYKPTPKTNNLFLAFIIFYSTISVVYGAYEAFSFKKPFYNWIVSLGYELKEQSEAQVRYGLWRAQAFTGWFTYFALSSCISYIMLSNIALRLETSSYKKWFVAFFCLIFLFGVVLTGDRTTMASSLIASLSLIPVMRKRKNVLLLIAITIVISSLLLFFSDFFYEVYFSMTHINEVSGSTTDMRISQFNAAYKYFELSPIWGHGLHSTSSAIRLFPNLLGSESFIFNVMYQRGIIGIISSLILATSTIIFFLRKRCYSTLLIYISFVFYNCVTLPVSEFYIYPFLIILYKNQIKSRERQYLFNDYKIKI